MRTAAFRYARPADLAAAVDAAQADGARVLAGGQALVQAMKLGLDAPARLVDIGGLDELSGIGETDAGIEIGAGVRVCELINSPLIARHAPALGRAARQLGDVQVRNRATIGGNVCFADPRANLSPALISLRAQLVTVGPTGEAVGSVDDAYVGVRRSAIAPGQILRAIRIPRSGGRGTYLEVARQPNGTPLVNVAVTVAGGGGGGGGVGVGVGGLATVPLRAASVERAVAAGACAEDAAACLQRGDATAFADLHAPAEYRLRVARVLVRRALHELAGADDGR
jgi:carbon-monoxide dehydrogenase medium subunit